MFEDVVAQEPLDVAHGDGLVEVGPRLQSCSQKCGQTRPVMAGIGLRSSRIAAACRRSPWRIALRYGGMSTCAGQFAAHGGATSGAAPKMEW